jgi:hypothetical protein
MAPGALFAAREAGLVQVFGRRLSERGDAFANPASENLHNSGHDAIPNARITAGLVGQAARKRGPPTR